MDKQLLSLLRQYISGEDEGTTPELSKLESLTQEELRVLRDPNSPAAQEVLAKIGLYPTRKHH